jgi:hypothetical protein
MTSRFRKELLPPARTFYEQALGRLTRRNSKGWALANCPFHKSQSGKSFSVHLDRGSFVCFGCGVRGSDILAFLRLHDRLTFRQACQRLGCWNESAKPSKPRPGPLVRYLVMDFVIDGVQYFAEIMDEPKNELQLLRRLHAEARDRLHEINEGGAEKFEGEEESQWSILADSRELIQTEVGYAR